MASIEFHSLAGLFRIHTEAELQEITESIREHGQHDACVIFEHRLLDGRGRWLACEKLGVKAKTRRFDPKTEGDPLDFVVIKNGARRHETASDRAMAAARMAPLFAERAEERRLINLKRGSENAKNAENSPKPQCGGFGPAPVHHNAKTPGEVLPSAEQSGSSLGIAAEIMGTSERSAERAAVILADAEPEVIEAVDAGIITVTDAAGIVDASPAVQRKAVEQVRSGKAKTAKAAIKNKKESKADGAPTDSLKCAVPESLAKIFAATSLFRAAMKSISDAKSAANKLQESKAGGWIEHQELDRLLTQARHLLRFAMPYTECPKCRRKPEKSCSACKGTAWIHEGMFLSAASDADKAWLAGRSA